MRKIAKRTLYAFAISAIILSGCDIKHPEKNNEDKKMDQFIDSLMSKMSLEDKVGQTVMFSPRWIITGPLNENNVVEDAKNGQVGAVFNAMTADFIYRLQKEVVENSPHKIPLLFAFDVIHGYATTFPTNIAQSTSWDMDMIALAAKSMSQEAAADGQNWTFAPMVDIARDPRWGRISEGAGEDGYLGSQIAATQVRAIQGDNLKDTLTLASCVKHFAAYGAALAGRDYNSVDMSERHLREFYLPAYKAAFDAGSVTTMASFNDLNGVPCHSNKWLFQDLLRKEWGFDGMVVTDYTGIMELTKHATAKDTADATAQAMNAGMDMDMQSGFYQKALTDVVKRGKVSEARLNEACRKILELKYKLGLFEDPYRYADTARAKRMLNSEPFIKNAREVAKRSIVLLKNDNKVLPLAKSGKSIALIGPMAADKYNQLGSWHVAGRENTVTPILDAFKAEYPEVKVNYAKGSDFDGNDRSMFAEALAAARKSDVVVMALGEKEGESGEAASKTDLTLSSIQKELIKEVKKANKPMVLLLHNGRPMILTDVVDQFDAILEVWHLGSQAGPAIADVVFGQYNPSGKLTTTFPRNMGQIPLNYNQLPTGRPMSVEKYTSKYVDSPNTPLFPFGYGLSYTTFEYSPVTLNKTKISAKDELIASVEVTNTGAVDGEEVVQLYIRDLVASVSRPMKELRGFKKVMIPAGKTVKVEFPINKKDLAFHDSELQFVAEEGDFKVFIGTNSDTKNEATFTLTESVRLIRP